MRTASDQPSSEPLDPAPSRDAAAWLLPATPVLLRRPLLPPRLALPRRTVALAVTLLVHLLLLLLLLKLSPPRTYVPMGVSRLISIALAPTPNPASPARARSTAKPAAAKAAAASAPAKAAPPPPAVPVTPTQPVPDVPLIRLTHDEMVGLDVTMRTRGPETASADAGDSGPSDSAKAGTGPRGQQLYAAQWYREPTHAELATYMPANVQGWGEVGCRTVARFHVEDCVELGESPRGSGMSRFVREAAWQFLVRPPRVNGHLMIGEWVRIRIDLVDRNEKPGR